MDFEKETMELQTVYMVDYKPIKAKKASLAEIPADNCLIMGISRDRLRPREKEVTDPGVFCPLKQEYYKDAVKRFKSSYPKAAEKMTKDIDPVPIENEKQDRNRTEYSVNYCPRDLPFMSMNLSLRAKALQTLRLPDDVYIPDTVQRSSFRPTPPQKREVVTKCDRNAALKEELSRILRVRAGSSLYQMDHDLLGKVILQEQPFGPAREEPNFGRWKSKYRYTYNIQ